MAGEVPTDAELCARVKAGDREAADMLVRRHTPGVVALANRTGYGGADLDDLIQVGLWALANNAAKGWSAANGSKFFTYATIVIRNALIGAVSKLKAREEERCETDRESSGLSLAMVAGREGGAPDIAGLLDRMTPLERGLVGLLYGLEGEPVKVRAAAARFGLTCRQAQEIVESAFLRLRKWSRDQRPEG